MACRCPARSPSSSRRPPAGQRAARLSLLAQYLHFHHQFADAPVGLIKLLLERIVLPFLETNIHAGQRSVAPFLQPDNRHRQLPRQSIHRLAAQQAQHDLLLSPGRPALDLGRRAGRASSRATRSSQPTQRTPTILQLIQHFPLPSQTRSFTPIPCPKKSRAGHPATELSLQDALTIMLPR